MLTGAFHQQHLTVWLGYFKWPYEGLTAFQIGRARGEVTPASFADATVQSRESTIQSGWAAAQQPKQKQHRPGSKEPWCVECISLICIVVFRVAGPVH
jgi:hypothetical protein